MTQESATDQDAADYAPLDSSDAEQLLPQLVAHLREHRTRLREEWASRIGNPICWRP